MSKPFSAVSGQLRAPAPEVAGPDDYEEYELIEAAPDTPAPVPLAEAKVPSRVTPVQPSNIWKLPPAHFARQARADVAVVRNQHAQLEEGVPYKDNLGRLRFGSFEQRMAQLAPLLTRSPSEVYTVEEEDALRMLFSDLRQVLVQLDRVSERYDDFYLHTGHAAFPVATTVYRAATLLARKHALRFYLAVADNQRLSRLLDEACPRYGLAAGSFNRLEKRVGELSTVLALRASQTLAQDIDLNAAAKQNPGLRRVVNEHERWMKKAIARDQTDLTTLLDGKLGVVLTFRADARRTKRTLLQWLSDTFVRPIATWLGDTRVGTAVVNATLTDAFEPGDVPAKTWHGERMVKPAHVKQVLKLMEPGDIGVVRQDWYLSNLKLPGHWPHTILHIGSPRELAAYFDHDPEVRALVAQRSQGQHFKLSEYLAAKFPGKWVDYNEPDERGEDKRVIEAISEGVLFTGPAHAFMVDYMGVMRPRVSKRDKAVAIERAFEMAGLPYDFNFDFATRGKIICSELVYRAYQPGDGVEKGLALPLRHVPDLGGRWTLPSEAYVEIFDHEHGSPHRQLDFVAYLQGDTKTQTARFASEAEFQKSHKLPQYDWQVPAATEKLRKEAAERVKLAQPWAQKR